MSYTHALPSSDDAASRFRLRYGLQLHFVKSIIYVVQFLLIFWAWTILVPLILKGPAPTLQATAGRRTATPGETSVIQTYAILFVIVSLAALVTVVVNFIATHLIVRSPAARSDENAPWSGAAWVVTLVETGLFVLCPVLASLMPSETTGHLLYLMLAIALVTTHALNRSATHRICGNTFPARTKLSTVLLALLVLFPYATMLANYLASLLGRSARDFQEMIFYTTYFVWFLLGTAWVSLNLYFFWKTMKDHDASPDVPVAEVAT